MSHVAAPISSTTAVSVSRRLRLKRLMATCLAGVGSGCAIWTLARELSWSGGASSLALVAGVAALLAFASDD